MCDYSIVAKKSRAAKKDDKLISRQFGQSRGFSPITDPTTAVCLLPGTELKFDKPVERHDIANMRTITVSVGFSEARFRQVHKDQEQVHHDVLEFPDGTQVYLTNLVEGQTATVLQLPAQPRTPAEAKEQERAAYVG